MNKLLMISLVSALALGCQQDNKNIERKLDQILAKLDRLPAGGAGAAQRPQRPEHDRNKVYSVPIDGDPFEGPADAPVTIVKAIDYA